MKGSKVKYMPDGTESGWIPITSAHRWWPPLQSGRVEFWPADNLVWFYSLIFYGQLGDPSYSYWIVPGTLDPDRP